MPYSIKCAALAVTLLAFGFAKEGAAQSVKRTNKADSGPSLKVTVAWLQENLPKLGRIRVEKHDSFDGPLASPSAYSLEIRNVTFEDCTLMFEQSGGWGYGVPEHG